MVQKTNRSYRPHGAGSLALRSSALIAASVSLLFVEPVVAQSPVAPTATAPSAGVAIRDIRIEGLQRIEPGTVFSYLPIQIGDRVTEQGTREAVRVLFATGFFKDVRLELDGQVLVVIVEERPAIGIVEVSGSQEIDKDQLLKALRDTGLAESRTFDKALLDRAEQELKRQYLSRGKYDVKIVTTVTPLERNRVAIQIAIDEGEDARIKEIRIVGAKAFKVKELLGEFKLSAPTMMTWYTKADQYSRQKLTGDLEALRSFYLNRGYLEFAVDSTQVSLSPDRKDVFITIVINEGEKYTVQDVRLVGDLLGREDEFKKLVTIKSGSTFSNQELQNVTKAINDRMADLGYAFSNVIPNPDIDRASGKVRFVLQVDPGRRVYVRRINISGNSRTRDEVIRREIRQFESAWYDADRIRLSRNRIDRLGFFKEVSVDPTPIPGVPDQVDLTVKVEERPLGTISGGVGFSSTESVVLTASLSQQNFLGTGTNVSIDVNTGRISQTLAVSHTDPYWTEDGISRALDFHIRRFEPDELSAGNTYSVKSQGAGVRFGLPYTEEDRIFVGANFEQSQYGGNRLLWPSRIAAELDRFGTDTFSGYSLTLGWSRDSRDSGIAPTRGRSQYANLDYATPFGTLEYVRLSYGHQYFHPLTKMVTLALNSEIGIGEGLGGKNYPLLKNFYVGGIGSVRGFKGGGIGGRDPIDNASLGGNRKFIFNSEVLTPLPGMSQDKTVRVFAFFDAGSVWQEGEPVAFDDLRASAGVGLSWLSPVGPLKISLGTVLKKKEADETQRFQFQIGTGF